jgi:hypothetical protein
MLQVGWTFKANLVGVLLMEFKNMNAYLFCASKI